MVGTLAVDQLLLGVEALAAGAVQAAVAAEVDVAVGVDAAEDLLHRADVVGVGGADEVVVAEPAGVPGVAEDATDAVGVGLRVSPAAAAACGDLVAVLVGAGDEERLVAALRGGSAPACRQMTVVYVCPRCGSALT